MSASSANLQDPEEIRMLFQRLCREGRSARLRFGAFQQDFPILAEQEEQIVLGIPGIIRGQWSLKPGAKLTLSLNDRGRPFEAIVEFGGHGTLNGVECGHLLPPRLLKCLDESRLADYVPEPPLRCSYSTRSLEIRDGFTRALGFEGIHLELENSRKSAQDAIRAGSDTVLELFLDKETRIVAPARFIHLTDTFAGVQFRKDGDQSFQRPYRSWLEEAIRSQRHRDLQAFDPKGAQASRAPQEERRVGSSIHLRSDREPRILVICEGEAFAERANQALGRRFGISSLDYVQGEIKPLLEPQWGGFKLLLIHQRLRVSSGLELTRQLVQDEKCPLPILVAGIEEDVALKRNRAIAAGAVDFISVEPFNVLKVMKSIADTLAMFG